MLIHHLIIFRFHVKLLLIDKQLILFITAPCDALLCTVIQFSNEKSYKNTPYLCKMVLFCFLSSLVMAWK